MKTSNGKGVLRVFNATLCSFKGLKAAYKYELAFRQELLLIILLFPISFYLARSKMHWLILITTLLLILFAEIINTALEALADKITLEYDEIIGRVKDLGSAAVFITLIIMLLVWGEAAINKLFF